MILNQICCLAFKFSLLEFEFFLQLIRPTMNSELKNEPRNYETTQRIGLRTHP